MRFVIDKVDFDPEKERKQDVEILVDADGELFSAANPEKAREKAGALFKRELEIGYEICEKDGVDYYFATFENAVAQPLTGLPEGWHYAPAAELMSREHGDGEAIKKAIERMGYEV